MLEKGTLYVCATPIGNLADITLRVLETLREVDLIAAEDTRHSRKLLEHYQITTPLTSYHEHNEKGKAVELAAKLKQGATIALISDAGLPGISDPGGEIIRLCHKEKINVDVLPGPNAALTALILSGLPAENFAFRGFLPAAKGARRRQLQEYSQMTLTQVFYEAPHRLVTMLEELAEICPQRQAVVVRELTKVHQNVHRGTVFELVGEFQRCQPRGECCLVLAAYVPELPQGGPDEWRSEVRQGAELGLTPTEVMKAVAKKYGVSKREVYKAMLEG